MIGDGTQQRVIVQIGLSKPNSLYKSSFTRIIPRADSKPNLLKISFNSDKSGGVSKYLTASAAMPRSSNRDTAARDLLQRGLWKILISDMTFPYFSTIPLLSAYAGFYSIPRLQPYQTVYNTRIDIQRTKR